MALTITHNAASPGRGAVSDLRGYGPPLTVWTGVVTFDNSYPTGGETFDLTTASGGEGVFKEVVQVVPSPLSNRIVTYDRTNKKLLLHTALGTEAANASDQSSITVRVVAFGYR